MSWCFFSEKYTSPLPESATLQLGKFNWLNGRRTKKGSAMGRMPSLAVTPRGEALDWCRPVGEEPGRQLPPTLLAVVPALLVLAPHNNMWAEDNGWHAVSTLILMSKSSLITCLLPATIQKFRKLICCYHVPYQMFNVMAMEIIIFLLS
jgi:hypothetical protein